MATITHRRGLITICSCNKNKDGSSAMFVVKKADGSTQEVRSEQEARAIVRITGGSYARK